MSARSPLGKGLSALFPELAGNGADRPAYILCGIEELTPNRFQPRKEFAREELEQLVASIKKDGVIQPIIVRRIEGTYEIIAGERRWRAAQAAGLKEVPVIVRTADDRELAELSLIENLQREDLNPIEEGEAYTTLVEHFGMTHDEIARRVGKDRSTVANTIRLLKLPPEIKKALMERRITAGHARSLLSLDKTSDQLALLRQIISRSLSVRECERIVKKKQQHPPVKAEDINHLKELERHLADALSTTVRIRGNEKGGSIEIRYSSSNQLQLLVDLLLSTTTGRNYL
ncbi:MAG: ParB/RepB/Spo0J family partition protein [Syntrophales bacterium]|nr:ParB/RepB/Spo0J family partition protein [Syntrophales bacterium]